MPCFNSGGGSIGAGWANADDRARALREELDATTDLLCALLRKHPKLAEERPDLAAWWKNHKADDKARGEP